MAELRDGFISIAWFQQGNAATKHFDDQPLRTVPMFGSDQNDLYPKKKVDGLRSEPWLAVGSIGTIGIVVNPMPLPPPVNIRLRIILHHLFTRGIPAYP